MDPKMYNAAKKGNMKDDDFSLDEHLKREEENGYQVTPNGNTILHVATLFGQQDFVRVLKVTPGLLCYKNKKNESALHIAANVGRSEVVSELLSVGGGETTLMRMTDDNGDTALHKAVRGGHLEIVRMLEKLVADFCSINGRLGQRDFKINRKAKTMKKIEKMRVEEEEEKAKREKIEIEKIMKAAQTQLVVATLIMTVTFAAGFTLPGGVESDDGPNKGTAILLKKAAFRAFVISDVLAFIFSAGAIFIYFFMAASDVDIDNEENEFGTFKVLRRLYYIAAQLQLLAMALVVVAFVTSMYVTLANSLSLAVGVCVIGCGSFYMYLALIYYYGD